MFTFLLLLSYVICTKESHCDTSIKHMVYHDQIHPLYPSSLLSPLFNRFHGSIFMHGEKVLQPSSLTLAKQVLYYFSNTSSPF
jgi:hypothetical protein